MPKSQEMPNYEKVQISSDTIQEKPTHSPEDLSSLVSDNYDSKPPEGSQAIIEGSRRENNQIDNLPESRHKSLYLTPIKGEKIDHYQSKILQENLQKIVDQQKTDKENILLSTKQLNLKTPEMKYLVCVDDNFHYMDESSRYTQGVYKTADEAISVAKAIVNTHLRLLNEEGLTKEQLYDRYKMFGEDPFIISEDKSCIFSAWDYASEQCKELCSQNDNAELLKAGIELAGFYIESGKRSFEDCTKTIIADLGEDIRPFLKSIYSAVYYYPGFDNTGMTSPSEIESFAKKEMISLGFKLQPLSDEISRLVLKGLAQNNLEVFGTPIPDELKD